MTSCMGLMKVEKMKKKVKLIIKVQKYYGEVDEIADHFQHLFRDMVEEMGKQLGQYLGKWFDTVNLARYQQAVLSRRLDG